MKYGIEEKQANLLGIINVGFFLCFYVVTYFIYETQTARISSTRHANGHHLITLYSGQYANEPRDDSYVGHSLSDHVPRGGQQ